MSKPKAAPEPPPQGDIPADILRVLDLKDAPGHLIRLAHRRMTSLFEETAHLGLTAPQFAVLWTVELAPDLEQSEIAQLAVFDAATTGGIIARLEALQLVERIRSGRSRRGRAVKLTQKGERLVRTARSALPRVRKRLFENLRSDEQDEFMRLLSKLLGVTNSYYQVPRKADPGRPHRAIPNGRRS